MKKTVDIAVSTDPVSDYQNIIEYAKSLQGVADFLHCDVMNENFVEKTTYDYNLLKNINRNTLIMLDVHVMANEPYDDVEKYMDAGANILTLHYEAFSDKQDLVDAINLIKEKGGLAGIAIKPATTFKEVKSYAFNADFILVMGVEPGRSGQVMKEEMIDKVREINKFREENNLNFKIEFDGGVNVDNHKTLVEAGCDILVSGMYIFSSKDRKKAIKALKEV